MDLKIVESNVETAVLVSKQIPEFLNPHPEEEYLKRLKGKSSLILVAFDGEIPVGFKVGYDKSGDGIFYSWMGGVLRSHRHKKVATALAEKQEEFAKSKGFHSVLFKTRNRHKGMLIFALKNGFNIVGFEAHESEDENRILLQKKLQGG